MGRGTAIDVHAGGQSGKGGEEKDRPEDRWSRGPPQDGDSTALAARGVPQVDARVAPAVLTASGLLLGAEMRARTFGLGPSAPSSSAGGVSCARAFSGPGPATAGYPGPGLCASISRDAGPPGPGHWIRMCVPTLSEAWAHLGPVR